MPRGPNPGAGIAIHFMAMEYMLRGPLRTVRGLQTEMWLGAAQPAVWVRQLVQQKYVSPTTEQNPPSACSKAIQYSPNKVIVDKAEYNDLRKRCGLEPV